MSLTTRCPACATLFRVVPDQLKVADGWVRCGQCSEVFDAASQLQGPQAPPAAPPAGRAGQPDSAHGWGLPDTHGTHDTHPAPGSPGDPGPVTAPAPFDPTPYGADAQAPAPSPRKDDSEAESEAEQALAEAHLRPVDLLLDDAAPTDEPARVEPTFDAEPAPAQPGTRLAPDEAPAAEIEAIVAQAADDTHWPWSGQEAPVPVAPASPATDAPAFEPEEATPAPDSPPPSFVRQARRRAFWRRRPVRALLWVLSLALSLLLALQLALHHRNALAALQPDWAPWLQRLCAPVGCRLGPPRQIEAIAIESSTFSRLRPDAFRLGLTLRNQSIMALEMPALELTLTDAEDRPVLRRVLLPSELGPAIPPVLLPGAEWSTALTLGVAAGAPTGATGANGAGGNAAVPAALGARIAGYRLLAFYP